jgi:hypothetical protein
LHTWVGVGYSHLPPIFSLQPSFLPNFKPCEVFLISIHFFHLEEPTLEVITRCMGTSTFTNVKVVLITYITFVVVIVLDIFVWWIHDTFPFYIMPLHVKHLTSLCHKWKRKQTIELRSLQID